MTWTFLGIKTADYSAKRKWFVKGSTQFQRGGGRCSIAFAGGGASAVLDLVMMREIEGILDEICEGKWKRAAVVSTVQRFQNLTYTFSEFSDAWLFHQRYGVSPW